MKYSYKDYYAHCTVPDQYYALFCIAQLFKFEVKVQWAFCLVSGNGVSLFVDSAACPASRDALHNLLTTTMAADNQFQLSVIQPTQPAPLTKAARQVVPQFLQKLYE